MFTFGGWFYLLQWIVRLGMIPVVAHRRRKPLEAIAWLAVIFFAPLLGTLLYLWLGEYTFRRGERRHREARRRIGTLDPQARQRPHVAPRLGEGSDTPLLTTSENLLRDRLGGLPVLGGNRVELLEEGEVVERMIRDVEAARHHAHLLFFIYAPDDTGWRVARALAAAAERGVRCRLLADAWASRAMFREIRPWLVERGVEVHKLLKIEPLSRPLARVDLRNHRKLAVIDGKVAYTGSANVHDPGHELEEGVWHQIAVRLEGPTALQMQLVFLEDWLMATGRLLDDPGLLPAVEARGEVAAQAFPSGPAYRRDALQHLVAEVLHGARERVVVTTPYFIPDEATRVALRLAALRGAEVDVVVPETSDRRVADAAGRAYFAQLMEVGVRIHRHPSGILHAKTISVDDTTALVGTANLDWRSLFLNYEVLLVLHHPRVAAELRERQLRYVRDARRVDPDAWSRRSTWERVRDDTARLLSPVL